MRDARQRYFFTEVGGVRNEVRFAAEVLEQTLHHFEQLMVTFEVILGVAEPDRSVPF